MKKQWISSEWNEKMMVQQTAAFGLPKLYFQFIKL